jgi:tetratricopeptide (TPR) repeat protein
VGCLALYLSTLAPGLVGGDSGDLATAAGSLGIAHPPGYPTYTLLGWLFSRLHPGNVALTLNLMSALFGAAAASFIFLGAAELTGSRAAGAAAGLAYALSPVVWSWSVVAEVFTMNACFAGLLLWLALRLVRRPHPTTAVLLAGVFGLGLSHHHTLVLLAPALALAVILARPPGGWRLAGLGAAAFAAGLLPYLYIPLRAPANPGLNWGDARTLGALLSLVTRAEYGSLSLLPQAARAYFPETSPWLQMPVYLRVMFWGPGLPAGLLALVGLAWPAAGGRQRWWPAAFLGLAWLATGPFFLALAHYPVEDPFWEGVLERFYILPQVPLALLAGCGAAWLGARLRPALAGVLALLVAGCGLASWSRADRSGDTAAADYLDNFLASVPRGAIVLTLGDAPGMLLDYAQYVEGRRPDLVLLDQEKLTFPWYIDSRKRRHPDVVFPWNPAYRRGVSRLSDFVDLNYGRRPLVFWGFNDDSVGRRYRLLPLGLAQRVAAPEENPGPRELAAQIEKRWAGYQRRSLDHPYSPRTFEYLITSFYGFPFYSVGVEFQRARQPEEAEFYYRKALQVAPHYAPPYRQMARLLLEQGRVAQARPLLQEYLRLNPHSPESDEVRQILASLPP